MLWAYNKRLSVSVIIRKEFHLVSQPVRHDEMKDIENLQLRYQAEFLPIILTYNSRDMPITITLKVCR